MCIKKTLISIVLASLSSVAFALLGMLPSLLAFYEVLIRIIPFIYGAILFFCLYTNDGKQLALRIILALLLNITYNIIEIYSGIFPYIFIWLHPNYGNPNMGDGLCVFVMQIYNLIAFVITVAICVSIYLAKRSINQIHQEK